MRHERLAAALQGGAEGLDRAGLLSDALFQVGEVVGEREMDDPVGLGGSDAQALEVGQLAPLHLGARGGERVGRGV